MKKLIITGLSALLIYSCSFKTNYTETPYLEPTEKDKNLEEIYKKKQKDKRDKNRMEWQQMCYYKYQTECIDDCRRNDKLICGNLRYREDCEFSLSNCAYQCEKDYERCLH